MEINNILIKKCKEFTLKHKNQVEVNPKNKIISATLFNDVNEKQIIYSKEFDLSSDSLLSVKTNIVPLRLRKGQSESSGEIFFIEIGIK